MPEYTVTWTIELDAESPEEAARQALRIHRDPESIASVFNVTGPDGVTVEIDLQFDEEADRAND